MAKTGKAKAQKAGKTLASLRDKYSRKGKGTTQSKTVMNAQQKDLNEFMLDQDNRIALDTDGEHVLKLHTKRRDPFGRTAAAWRKEIPSDAPDAWKSDDGKPTAKAQSFILTVDGKLSGLPDMPGCNVLSEAEQRAYPQQYLYTDWVRSMVANGITLEDILLAINASMEALDGFMEGDDSDD